MPIISLNLDPKSIKILDKLAKKFEGNRSFALRNLLQWVESNDR